MGESGPMITALHAEFELQGAGTRLVLTE